MSAITLQRQIEERIGYYHWLGAAVQALQPMIIVELGTREGISLSFLSMHTPEHCRIITVDNGDEGKPHIPIHLRGLKGVQQIIGDDCSDEVLSQIPDGVEMLFIDTKHTREQVEKEWKLYEPKLAEQALVVCDDINALGGWFEELPYDKLDISGYHQALGFGFFIYKRK